MSNYYDLDEILADAEKVPCRFNMTVPGLGYLEGNPGKAIQKDTKLELPTWLAEVLAVCELLKGSGDSFVDLSEPDCISTKVKNAIKTSPTAVDLHKLLPNYYKMVEKWCSMFDNEELVDLAMAMLKERSYEISNFAGNANKQINNEFIYTLDEFEKKLLKMTSESNKHMRRWWRE